MATKTIKFHGLREDQHGLKRPWKVYAVSCTGIQGGQYQVSIKGMSEEAESTLIGHKLIQSTSEQAAVDDVVKQLKLSPLHKDLKTQEEWSS